MRKVYIRNERGKTDEEGKVKISAESLFFCGVVCLFKVGRKAGRKKGLCGEFVGREIEKRMMRKGGMVGSFFLEREKESGGRREGFWESFDGGVFLLCVAEKACESEVLIFLVREAQMERGTKLDSAVLLGTGSEG